MEYKHAQTGYLWIIVFLWLVFVGGLVLALTEEDQSDAALALGVSSVVVAAVVFWFNRLVVQVASGEVRVSFGPGWPRRIVATRDIIGFRQVRNTWHLGWGMRKVPGGWMYNVWGLDAVELDLANGKKFRIGTDEPSDVLAALSAHTALRAG